MRKIETGFLPSLSLHIKNMKCVSQKQAVFNDVHVHLEADDSCTNIVHSCRKVIGKMNMIIIIFLSRWCTHIHFLLLNIHFITRLHPKTISLVFRQKILQSMGVFERRRLIILWEFCLFTKWMLKSVNKVPSFWWNTHEANGSSLSMYILQIDERSLTTSDLKKLKKKTHWMWVEFTILLSLRFFFINTDWFAWISIRIYIGLIVKWIQFSTPNFIGFVYSFIFLR